MNSISNVIGIIFVGFFFFSIIFYKQIFKRFYDILLSVIALVVFSPLFVFLIVLGAIKMKGNPFYIQLRPGKKRKDGKEKIFKLIKFRSMTCEKDGNGNFLSDEKRLTLYGRRLRATSLDELPELFNILKGDMSIVGPRPQLVRDLVFMNEKQRLRHNVSPGLTGLAQVKGRNAITWSRKFEFDLKYIENISFFNDLVIVFLTVKKIIGNIFLNSADVEIADDFGVSLLKEGTISVSEFEEKIHQAIQIEKNCEKEAHNGKL